MALKKKRLPKYSQIRERTVRVGISRGSSLAKLKQGAIFESFTFQTLSQTVYL